MRREKVSFSHKSHLKQVTFVIMDDAKNYSESARSERALRDRTSE